MFSIGNILYEGISIIFKNRFKADFEINSLTDLTINQIDYLIEYYSIKGVILDVDETLRYNMRMIPKEHDEWLEMIKKKLKVIALSNGYDGKIAKILNEKGIEYIGLAYKPFNRNFIKACQLLGLNSKNVVVIGDDVLCDIYGGNKNNMTTIKVRSKKSRR